MSESGSIFGDYGWIGDIWGAFNNDDDKPKAGSEFSADNPSPTWGQDGSVTEEEAGPVEEGNSFWEKAASAFGVTIDYLKENPWLQQLVRQAGVRIFSDKPSFDWDRFKQAQIDTTVMRSPDYFNQFGQSQVVVDPETGKKTVTGEMAPWLTDMVNAMVSRSASPMNAYQKPEAFNALLGEYIGDREDYFGIPRSGSTTQQHNIGGYGSPVNIDIGGPMSPKAPGADPTGGGSVPSIGDNLGYGGGANIPLPGDEEGGIGGQNGWSYFRDILYSQGASPEEIEEAQTLYEQAASQGNAGAFADWFSRNWKSALGGLANLATGNWPGFAGNVGKIIMDRMNNGEYGDAPPLVDASGNPITRPDGTPVYPGDADADQYSDLNGRQPDVIPGGGTGPSPPVDGYGGVSGGGYGDFWSPPSQIGGGGQGNSDNTGDTGGGNSGGGVTEVIIDGIRYKLIDGKWIPQ